MSLIAAVEGLLEGRSQDHVLVRVAGITLRLYVSLMDLASLDAMGQGVRLYTHLAVKKDDLQLYGFLTEQGCRMFQLLLEVGGVGPRVALAVLSGLTPESAASAILAGDPGTLSKAPGVGKRTAERIILELKSKVEVEFRMVAAASSPAVPERDEALRAIVALGYTILEARQALAVERGEGLVLEERVRRALQRMG